MKRRPDIYRVWALPALLGIASMAGLVAALVLGGAGDAVSWIALAIPIMVIIHHARR